MWTFYFANKHILQQLPWKFLVYLSIKVDVYIYCECIRFTLNAKYLLQYNITFCIVLMFFQFFKVFENIFSFLFNFFFFCFPFLFFFFFGKKKKMHSFCEIFLINAAYRLQCSQSRCTVYRSPVVLCSPLRVMFFSCIL